MQVKDFTPQDLFPKMLPASFWKRVRKEVPNILEEQFNFLYTPDVIKMPVYQLNQHKAWLLTYLEKLTDQLSSEGKKTLAAFNEKALSNHLEDCITMLAKNVQNNLLNYIKIQYDANVANNASPLTEKNIEAILQKHPIVFIEFWATWCAPCKELAPTINQLINQYKPHVYFGKVDIDQEQTLAQRYEVQSIPTILLFKNGTLANRLVGNQPFNELKKALDDLLESE